MPTQQLSGTTALVTGAGWGFGRAIAVALAKHGAHVAGVERDPARLEELHAQLGGTFTPVAADAADPVVALGIRFTSVLPQLTPETDLGAAGVAACAARQGVDIPASLDRLGPALTQPGRATPAASDRPKLGP
jgi:NAD(P)-dependent dehydrogenase (short-subunit alcohol dehydrogenase family)